MLSTTPSQNVPRALPTLSGVALIAYGGLCYLLFGAVFTYWLGFLLNLSVAKGIDTGTPVPTGFAIGVNLALIALFGFTHSLMARKRFKDWWTRIIPPAAERATYVLQSSLFLALTIWQWQPMPAVVWSVEGWAAAALYAVFGLGAGLILASSFALDHLEFFGLNQVWCGARAKSPKEARFRTPLLYRIVRHPLQLGILLVIFATPEMTVGHLIFAIALTVYMRIGLYFEERALVREFGDDYRVYQATVPMLIPGLRPRPISKELLGAPDDVSLQLARTAAPPVRRARNTRPGSLHR